MIDKQLELGVYQTLNEAHNIFCKKAEDYGTAWRVYRMISLADQLFIKAQRIGIISGGVQKIIGSGNDIESEFRGIINYSIIGIIQNRLEDLKSGEPPMPIEEAKESYSDVIKKFHNYFLSQNPYYVEEIEKLQIKDMSDMLVQKIERLKKIHLKNKEGSKILVFGALMEILMWASIGHVSYKSTH